MCSTKNRKRVSWVTVLDCHPLWIAHWFLRKHLRQLVHSRQEIIVPGAKLSAPSVRATAKNWSFPQWAKNLMESRRCVRRIFYSTGLKINCILRILWFWIFEFSLFFEFFMIAKSEITLENDPKQLKMLNIKQISAMRKI